MTTTGLPRRARVRTGRDFDRIFKLGRRLGTPLLAPVSYTHLTLPTICSV